MIDTSILCEERKKLLASDKHLLVLGGPGSGKTTIALLKARKEIESNKLTPHQRLLFLSFARTTLSRVASQSQGFLSNEQISLLDMNTYHGFAWNILRSHGYLLRNSRELKVFTPAAASAHFAGMEAGARKEEMMRLFKEEGLVHFDLFSKLTTELLTRSLALRKIYSAAFPIIFLDEFQDTDENEWSLIQTLGQFSRLIALADPDQRIYEFRGADPARISEYATHFIPETFDFGTENHRSQGTDIVQFANDLLKKQTQNHTYKDVDTYIYSYQTLHNELHPAKELVLKCRERLIHKQEANWSLAVLVPSNQLMMKLSEYCGTDIDGLPRIEHEVAFDTEGPALAGAVIASLLDRGGERELHQREFIRTSVAHIRGRRGSRSSVAQKHINMAAALQDFADGKPVRGSAKQKLISDYAALVQSSAGLVFSGDAGEDWLKVRGILAGSDCSYIQQIAEDAKLLRLFRKGTILQTNLSQLWRDYGSYLGALKAVQNALVESHFVSTSHEMKGIHIMTIHKAKGKEFDEVLIVETQYNRIVRANSTSEDVEQSRLSLRVAVTRARQHATILTPKAEPCPLLIDNAP